EIWPRTKRSPPSMKRTMRSLMAPSVTRPATPIAIPAIANAYPRRILSTPRLVRSGSQTRLACGCGSYAPVHRLASPAAAARTLRLTDSPRLRLRLGLTLQTRRYGLAGPPSHPDVHTRDREKAR